MWKVEDVRKMINIISSDWKTFENINDDFNSSFEKAFQNKLLLHLSLAFSYNVGIS